MGWRANYDLVYQTSLWDFPNDYFESMNMTNVFSCSLVPQLASINHYPHLDADYFHSLPKFSVLYFLSNNLEVFCYEHQNSATVQDLTAMYCLKRLSPHFRSQLQVGQDSTLCLGGLEKWGFLNAQRNSLCIYRRNVQIHPTIFISTHIHHMLQIKT